MSIKFNRIITISLSIVISLCLSLGFNVSFAAESANSVWLDALTPTASERYTGNMGDSFIDKLGTRNPNADVDGNTYERGLEAWVARWNSIDEISWVWSDYSLENNYNFLTGKIVLIDSYNTQNFDTMFNVYGDDKLLYSFELTASTLPHDINIGINGVKKLRVELQDSKASSGGTSFGLIDFLLTNEASNNVAKQNSNEDMRYNGDHTYRLIDRSMTWQAAKDYCESLGGHLATVTSQQEQDFLVGLLDQGTRNSYWLGALASQDTGDFDYWITGEKISYTNWARNQPDNFDRSENVLMMYRSKNPLAASSQIGSWNDLRDDGTCNNEAFFGIDNIGIICEWDSLYTGDMLNQITDQSSAVSTITSIASAMTTEEKRSSTGIDIVTLFSEEAVAQAASKEVQGNSITISQSNMNDLQSIAVSTKAAAQEALASAGISVVRELDTGIKFKTQEFADIKIIIDPSAFNTVVDNVCIETPKYKITLPLEAIKTSIEDSPLTISVADESINTTALLNPVLLASSSREYSPNRAPLAATAGGKAYKITFSKPVAGNVKISLPTASGDPDYQAIVKSDGTAVGGKYNPATGMLDARIRDNDIYLVKENRKDFNDIQNKSNEMQQAIRILASKGIIGGTSAAAFSPDSTITRAEIAALIVRTLSKLDPSADGKFSDVKKSDWFFAVAGSSKKYGIINGYDNGTFKGRVTIPKDQIVAICARTLRSEMKYKIPDDAELYLKQYADRDKLPEWAVKDLSLAVRENLVAKRDDGRFAPAENMTRGEAAVILKRMFDKIW